MLSFQLKQELEVMLEAYENGSDFIDGLRLITESFPQLNDLLSRIGESGSEGASAANNMRVHLNQLRKKISPISPRRFFASMESFQRQLSAAKQLEINDLGLIDKISSRIDEFSENYENYIKKYTSQAAGPLIVEARTLSELLDGFYLAVRLSYVNLESGKPEQSEQTLTIYLPGSMPLEQFANRLLAIHRLYEEFANLIGVDLTRAPLRLEKAESGSLWSRVFGDVRVIGLIVEFLRGATSFIYRNYTKEGRLTAIPQKLDSLDSILNFSNRLKAEGVNTEEIEEQLRASAVYIAKDINTLIGDQSSVTINGETQSVGAEVQKSLETFNSGRTIGYSASLPNRDELPPPTDDGSPGEDK